MYNFDTLTTNIGNAKLHTIIGIVVFIYILIALVRNKVELKERKLYKIILVGACVWTLSSIQTIVLDSGSLKNPEICEFRGSITSIFKVNSYPECHFRDENGRSYVVFVTNPAMKEMNNNKTLEKGKTYIIHYEKGSMTIVAIEEVE